MIKRIIFLLLAVLFELGLQAQNEEKKGTWYADAIPVVFTSEKGIFTDIRNTATGPPWYYACRYIPRGSDIHEYTRGGAVYYEMVTTQSGDIIIHNWNSYGVGHTTIFLLQITEPEETDGWPGGEFSFKRVATFEELDFLSPDFDPVALGMLAAGGVYGQAYLRIKNLPAGTYHIVVAGYKYSNASVSNGLLGTTVIATFPTKIPSEPEIKPEQPNDNPVRYQYDLSGNRIKTIKK